MIAGVIRGQYKYLEEHIAQKRQFMKDIRKGFKDLPIQMNPIVEGCVPNYWLSAFTIDPEYMCRQVRGECEALYISEAGKTCPTEILEVLNSLNAEGRPIWKPMHMQPHVSQSCVYHGGWQRQMSDKCVYSGGCVDVGADIFNRGLCLPSDNKMTDEQIDLIIEVVKGCFE